MADSKLPALTELAEQVNDNDLFYIVDISDTTDSADGTSKQIKASNITANNYTDADKTVVGNTSGTNTGDQDLTDMDLNTVHRASNGTDHSNVVLNDTHRGSDGTDHTYIDQDISSGSSPTFDGVNITGIDAVNVDIADSSSYYTGTNVELALQEIADGTTLDDSYLLRSAWNGTFQEAFNALITSNGTTITMSLQSQTAGDLTMQFSDVITTLDCTPAQTTTLTAGTTASPQANYVYIPISTKTLTVSTSSWASEEHIKIGYFYVQSAVDVQSDGALINQNWNDALKNGNNTGHITHMAQWIRRQGATYFSGCDGGGTSGYITPYAGGGTFQVNAGVIAQMHSHSYPSHDTSGTDVAVVPNYPSAAFTQITDLNDILVDSTGANLTGRYFNIIIGGVANKGGEYSPLMVKLPAGSYNSSSNAIDDVDGFDSYAMPREFNKESSTGFLIARVTIRNQSDTTFTVVNTQDLRGMDGAISGGSIGGGTTTDFADNQFTIYNNTDATKIINFDVSGITTGNTRTITPSDADMTILSTADYTDLTDTGDSALHYHTTDRARANHTGTQGADTVIPDTTNFNNNLSGTDNTVQKALDTLDNMSSSALSDGDYGDITVSGSGTVMTIDDNTIGLSELSATGTPSSSNFLRGDNTWATPAGSGNVSTSGTPVANDFARFVGATDIEGRSYAEVKADLNLEIGTDVQAHDTQLDSIAGLIPGVEGKMITSNGLGGYQISTVGGVRSYLNVEDGAEANNISDANATDLTDAGDSILHYHATDRNRTNHTGTQLASTISNFDTEVGNNVDVAANTAKNTYPSADATKLAGIEALAEVNTVDSVNAQTGVVVLDADDISDTVTINKYTTAAEITKLGGIETLADVTDTANVTSAGALMDSEVDADIKTLTLPASTTISTFGANLIDDVAASNARTTLGLAIGTDVQAHSAVLDNTTASYTTAEETKLTGVETLADITDYTNVNSSLSSATNIPSFSDSDELPIMDVSSSDTLYTVTVGSISNHVIAGFVTATATLTNKDISSNTNTFPSGTPIQIQSATNTTNNSSASTTYIDSGLTDSITPSSTSNKVLITISQALYNGTGVSTGINLRLLRGSTSLALIGYHIGYISGSGGLRSVVSYTYLDSPSTTSSVTYKTQFARSTGSGSVAVNQDSTVSSIVLQEIQG